MEERPEPPTAGRIDSPFAAMCGTLGDGVRLALHRPAHLQEWGCGAQQGWRHLAIALSALLVLLTLRRRGAV